METELDYTASFGYWVRRRRVALDLTQKVLASQVGRAMVTIRKIETDERRPSQQMAERLAECLNIASEQRAIFIRSARGELAIDRLALPQEPAAAPPAFLQQSTADIAEKPEFVAREPELQKLQEYLGAALDRQGCIAFVTGEAGQGKTYLLSEMTHRAQDAHANLIVASGSCNAFSGAGDPYLPFRDILGMLSGDVEPRWAAGAISREHAIRLWNLMPHTVQALLDHGPDLNGVFVSAANLAKRAAAAAPTGLDWLARLLRLAEQERSAPKELEQRQIFEQYTQVLRTLAMQQPMLLLLDDLQWADGASIDLLFHLGRRLAGSRIMILGAYRPSEVALVNTRSTAQQHPLLALVNEFKSQYGDIQLKLGEVGSEAGRGFVDELLDREPNQLGELFRTALFERTQGHPLFTVEMLRDMQERGDLIQDEATRWVAADRLDWEALPVRVEAVIEQRIGRLEPALMDILEVASIEGELFTAQVVARVQKLEVRAVLQQLSRELGTHHRLVREHEDEADEEQRLSRFRFSHILFQDYLYNRLSAGERRLLHSEVATALEQLYSGKPDAPILRLARHYAAAGEHERAQTYFQQAGQRAEAMYALAEAIVHYTNALEETVQLEVDAAARVPLHRRRGLAHETLGGFEAARADYEAALQLAEPAGDLRSQWRASLDLGKLWAARDYSRTGEYFEGAIALARRLDDPPALGRSLNRLGNWYANAERPNEGIAYHEEALEIFEGLDDRPGLADTLDLLGMATVLGADTIAGADFFKRAIDLYRELGDRNGLVSSLATISQVSPGYEMQTLISVFSFKEALQQVDEAITISIEIGWRAGESYARWSRAHLLGGGRPDGRSTRRGAGRAAHCGGDQSSPVDGGRAGCTCAHTPRPACSASGAATCKSGPCIGTRS